MAETQNNGESASESTEPTKSFRETAQETITGAVGATVGAVKEHPVAAAAIAAGAAAAVGGAAYAASQLRSGKEDDKSK